MIRKEFIGIKNLRAFIKKALESKYQDKFKINFSEFSREAGFSSRSFIREYLKGEKNLSESSFKKIKRSLSLFGKEKKYIDYLFLLEYPQFDIYKRTYCELEKKFKHFQSQLESNNKAPSQIISNRNVYLVYASLGEIDKGASIDEIIQKSKLSKVSVHLILTRLLEQNIIYKEENKYFVNESNKSFENLSSQSGLSNLVNEVCTNIDQQKNDIIENKEKWIQYTALSVESTKIDEMKNELRDSINDIIAKYYCDSGKEVKELFISFF